MSYGSEESILMTEKIHKVLAIQSYTSSVIMAKERGAFNVFSLSKEKDHPFVSKVLAECPLEIQKMYKSFGRRNIANLTIAPAGSMSIMCQTTSGCEPAFRLNYTRRKKNMNASDRADFVDAQGDKWTEFEVFHHGHLEWARINGKDPKSDIKDSPYYGSTANDINWLKKVEMQAAAQRWVDHSISNTTNVPSDTTVDTVKDIYMKGWKDGCKGITIYRDKSRSGVLIEKPTSSGTIEAIQETHAPKRPKSLPCDIHRAKVKGEEYVILVGLLHGKPYEIFCGLAANIEVGKKEKHGKLVKHSNKTGPSTYNLILNDEETFENVVDLFDNPLYGSLSRTLSTSLRHGVPIQYIVEQLRKDKYSDMFSFSTVVARVLSKSYIADGTKTTEKVCTQCSSNNLSYQQGCVSCLDCGYSKCG
jgi:ribonucleoside-diphosphate reductase alpha chain